MTIPVPKFTIGDIVYLGRGSTKEMRVQCPDCLGTKTWAVKTPAGEEFDVECSKCSYGYQVLGYISEITPDPQVLRLTIGSVRLDTEDKCPVSYMCVETGIGTGSVWHEDDLTTDEVEAQLIANTRAQECYDTIIKRNAETHERERKRSKRKPSLDKRRIKALEKEIKELKS